ncbi:MAG: cyclase family protein [Bryobacteraceae bacterium]|nr:cyclase family protein [Bryobacteraceae bacterium]
MDAKSAPWVDVTVPLRQGMPQWPGDPAFESRLVSESPRVTAFDMCAHTGTHIDAPSHYFAGAAGTDLYTPGVLIGPARVAGLNAIPRAERILFRTSNSDSEWWREPFRQGMAELTEGHASELVQGGARLVGIDYLSIGSEQVHRILLAAGICIVEGLWLGAVAPGEYEMICLPLKLEGADGAPARVLLRQTSSPSS